MALPSAIGPVALGGGGKRYPRQTLAVLHQCRWGRRFRQARKGILKKLWRSVLGSQAEGSCRLPPVLFDSAGACRCPPTLMSKKHASCARSSVG